MPSKGVAPFWMGVILILILSSFVCLTFVRYLVVVIPFRNKTVGRRLLTKNKLFSIIPYLDVTTPRNQMRDED